MKIDTRNKEIIYNILIMAPAMFILGIGFFVYVGINSIQQQLVFNGSPNMLLALIMLNLSFTSYLFLSNVTLTTHKYAKDKNIKGERNACCVRDNLIYLNHNNLFQCATCKRIFET